MMTNIYESELLYKLMERDGLNVPSSIPPYESEIKDYLIDQVKLGYPKLTDYEAEWLLYNYTNHLPAEFPIETITNVTDATVNNVVPYAYKSTILKGSTKYRDIDTGEVLDAFEDGRNLELVSVKMPVLTATGKNLLWNLNPNNPDNNFSSSGNGTTQVLYSEEEQAFYTNQHRMIKLTLKPNTKYTFSATSKNRSEGTSSYVWLLHSPYTLGFGQKTDNWERFSSTFTTNSTGEIVLCIYNSIYFKDIQLEESPIVTSYEPHKSNILTVNEEVELCGIGDVQDELNLLTGEITQRIGEIVIDGSEDWSEWKAVGLGPDIFGVVFSPAVNSKSGEFLCDKLPAIIDGFVGLNSEYIYFAPSGRIALGLNKNSITSINDVIDRLSKNPITVQYQLATESIKTVDLSVVDENGNEIKHFMPIEGTMHIQTDGEPIKPTVTMEIPVEATTQNLASFIEMEVE